MVSPSAIRLKRRCSGPERTHVSGRVRCARWDSPEYDGIDSDVIVATTVLRFNLKSAETVRKRRPVRPRSMRARKPAPKAALALVLGLAVRSRSPKNIEDFDYPLDFFERSLYDNSHDEETAMQRQGEYPGDRTWGPRWWMVGQSIGSVHSVVCEYDDTRRMIRCQGLFLVFCIRFCWP